MQKKHKETHTLCIMDKVKCTINEMMHDRGYSSNNDTVYTKDNHEDVMIIYTPENKLGINHVKQLKSTLDDNTINHCIVVYANTITSFAKNSIDEMQRDYEIELFSVKELAYNITKHALVPKHILMDNNFKKELLKTFKVHENKMPCISSKDPICKYYNAKVGTLIKIDRNPGIYFRIVV